jgi:hypothetical protein
VKSSRDAVGAKLTVTTASGRKLYNQVSISVGLMSSSDKKVHFGLGSERAIKSVEIQWPSGKRQTVNAVVADKVLHVTEPD